MARYHIRSAHTTEDCLGTLDQFVAQVPNDLPRWDFGCAAGDHSNHVAYAVVEAPSEGRGSGVAPGSHSRPGAGDGGREVHGRTSPLVPPVN